MSAIRILVTGTEGQVARALRERAVASGVQVVTLGRPRLDLAQPVGIEEFIRESKPDVVVNAAAYTAVDRAESEPEMAEAVNGTGAGLVSRAAAIIGCPVVQLSTDYVFAGNLDRPYREDDPTGPVGAYGRSKLAGELAVAVENPNHVILRTSWVYSPFGSNFVKTMLRLAIARDEVSVVADQVGSPTYALDIADGIIAVARNLVQRPSEARLRGVFHMTGDGACSWADFAQEIFADSAARGGPSASVNRIRTVDYPTAAARPENSRLDCSRLREIHDVRLPDWRSSTQACVARLIAGDRHDGERT